VVNADEVKTRLTSVIYGNVLNSTGSVIPLIWDSIKKDYPLALYGTEMTRFMIDIEEAIDTIEYALEKDAFNVIPNLKSFKIKDLFEIYENEFGLKWKLGEPRIGEKYHEQMISPFEIERVKFDKGNNMFLLHNKNVYNENFLSVKGLSSDDCLVSKEELNILLKKHNFFRS
jgi:UDP-N-acetylglucosamine 4,6-dehydratase